MSLRITLCVLQLNLVVKDVFGVDGDEVKSVSVMEGDSVTLHTDTEIQTDDHILWMFGPKETLIAEIYMKSVDMHDSNETFGDRLKLDNQTGSLTITNIRITDTGLYELIFNNKEFSSKRYNVTAYARLPVPVIACNSSNCSSSSESSSSSKCVLLCSVLNVRDVSLSWYKGNSLLSSISVSDLNISLYLPLEVKYQDNNTYSCVLNNTITNQTQHRNIYHICQPCPGSSSWKDWIVPVVVVLVVILILAAAAIAVKCWETNKQTVQDHKEEEVIPMNNINNNTEPDMDEVIVERPISNGVAVHNI